MATLIARPDARPILEAWLDSAPTLVDAAASQPDAHGLRGRGRVYSVPVDLPAGVSRWVVRHYHRGGAIASLMADRYLRTGTPRPIREYRALQALERLGVPAPRAVGAAVYPAGPFYRGDLVTEWVPGSVDLAAVLFGAAQLDEFTAGSAASAGDPAGSDLEAMEAAMAAAGAVVRLLHERGVVHPDLNLKNILIAPVEGGGTGRRALVLDLDGARLRSGPLGGRARRQMLDRFHRSLRKWERRSGGAPLPPDVRAAFEDGYAAPAD